jgi:hypothetical protein
VDPTDPRYPVIAARRLQWDNLVWQVPILSFTAEAFLFTIALGAGTSRAARIISSLLALVITLLSMTLMVRHRQSEVMDAEWLEDQEKGEDGDGEALHGRSFQKRRDARMTDLRPGQSPLGSSGGRLGWIVRLVPLWPALPLWIAGLAMFGLAALTALVLAIGWPSVLE